MNVPMNLVRIYTDTLSSFADYNARLFIVVVMIPSVVTVAVAVIIIAEISADLWTFSGGTGAICGAQGPMPFVVDLIRIDTEGLILEADHTTRFPLFTVALQNTAIAVSQDISMIQMGNDFGWSGGTNSSDGARRHTSAIAQNVTHWNCVFDTMAVSALLQGGTRWPGLTCGTSAVDFFGYFRLIACAVAWRARGTLGRASVNKARPWNVAVSQVEVDLRGIHTEGLGFKWIDKVTEHHAWLFQRTGTVVAFASRRLIEVV